jgi:hypothetical protein
MKSNVEKPVENHWSLPVPIPGMLLYCLSGNLFDHIYVPYT